MHKVIRNISNGVFKINNKQRTKAVTRSLSSSATGAKNVMACSKTLMGKYRAKIIENTIISRSHLTPEISLRLITSECQIFHEPVNENFVFPQDPFWGFYWPGGQAVTRYILDNPEFVRNKNILDVGSGSGACSIAAIMCGANRATANDIDECADIAAHINAELNQVAIDSSTENLVGHASLSYDCVLVGDVFYDSDFAHILMPWLQQLLGEGKEVIIGDPGRHGITKNDLYNMELLAQYELPENCCIENNGFKYASVWKLLR